MGLCVNGLYSSLIKDPRGYDSIHTFVDRFSKHVHSIVCRSTESVTDVAEVFFQEVFRQHGLPDYIISERDPPFTSRLWPLLTHLWGIRLKMSSSHHLQTDGSSEIMDSMIENYLRCYCAHHDWDWDSLLTSAEFAYNSSVFESAGRSPFYLDLGWTPRSPTDLLMLRPDDYLQSIPAF